MNLLRIFLSIKELYTVCREDPEELGKFVKVGSVAADNSITREA